MNKTIILINIITFALALCRAGRHVANENNSKEAFYEEEPKLISSCFTPRICSRYDCYFAEASHINVPQTIKRDFGN